MSDSFWINKKVAVTGAGGFIGSHVVRFLSEHGARVTALVSHRSKQKPNAVRKKNLRVCVVDLNNRENTVRVLKNTDIVFHFAGLDGGTAYKQAHTHEILQTNTRIALNILDACKINRVSRLLLMSSVEVYAISKSSVVDKRFNRGYWFDEDIGAYAWVKRYTEILGKYYHDKNLRIAIARAGNVYGPGDDVAKGRVIPTFIHLAKANKPIKITAPKSKELTFMFVTDLARALTLLIEKHATGEPVNIIGSQRINLYELAKKVVDITGSKSKITYSPPESQSVHRNYSNKQFLTLTPFKEQYTIDKGIKHMCENI